jgi:hypothetical protein
MILFGEKTQVTLTGAVGGRRIVFGAVETHVPEGETQWRFRYNAQFAACESI